MKLKKASEELEEKSNTSLIIVVEMMSNGLITIGHNSGRPKCPIIQFQPICSTHRVFVTFRRICERLPRHG
jgi:hypothetical protein